MRLCNDDIQFIEKSFPVPYNTPETFGDYLLPKIQKHETLCTSVIAEVKKNILQVLIKKYHYRFFCRIDTDHKMKQPDSIVDKLMRSAEYDMKKNTNEPCTLDNFTTTMKDLARFRIVCNFIHDVYEVVEAIENNNTIKEKFKIEKKSSMEIHPGSRKSGERSVKLILEYKKQPGLFVEIQVMTQLSEAWDKKDHFLVYELSRRSPENEDENFPDYLDAKMHAMGELLYVADNYFEGLRESREKKEKNKS